LLTRLASGRAVAGSIIAGVAPAARKRVTLRGARMRSVLGIDVSIDQAAAILERLGCELSRSEKEPDELAATAPSFRPDIAIEEDLIEEVMRVHGIDDVPATQRAIAPEVGRSSPPLVERARHTAIEIGLSEALTYGFVSPAELEALHAPPAAVRLRNPLTEERSVMRTSLLPGLLDALRRARRRGERDVALFTVARCYTTPVAGERLPTETPWIAAVLAGERQLGLDKPAPIDVYDAKGVALELVERLSGKAATVTRGDAAHLHPRGAAGIAVGDAVVGRFGPLHPGVVESLDLDGECVVVEIDLHALEAAGRAVPQFRPIPVLPAVQRDLALVVSEDVAAGELASAIRGAAGELCESVKLFDRYLGKGVPDEHQSLAFHLVFRDPKAATDPANARTLTDQEVDGIAKQVVADLGKRFGAEVRGG
jgi:phenylalanyl-tRNA synthetase beta chain